MLHLLLKPELLLVRLPGERGGEETSSGGGGSGKISIGDRGRLWWVGGGGVYRRMLLLLVLMLLVLLVRHHVALRWPPMMILLLRRSIVHVHALLGDHARMHRRALHPESLWPRSISLRLVVHAVWLSVARLVAPTAVHC